MINRNKITTGAIIRGKDSGQKHDRKVVRVSGNECVYIVRGPLGLFGGRERFCCVTTFQRWAGEVVNLQETK